MAARGGSALSKRLCCQLGAAGRELSSTGTTGAAAASSSAAASFSSNSMPPCSSSTSIKTAPAAASLSLFGSNFTPRGQARGFRIRDLFNKELAAERKAALRADLAVGHFDDLKGAKTASKPFAAREVPERAALSLPSLDLDVFSRATSGEGASSSNSTTLGEVLARAIVDGAAGGGEGDRGMTIRGPLLLLLGSRASAEPALDSWARVFAAADRSLPLPIVDLTLFDRVSPILLAIPGGKSALLRGAAEGARRRGACVAAAHFGSNGRGRELRESLGATNALAGYACVLDCEVEEEVESGEEEAALRQARVRWVGAGEAEAAEEPGLREVVEALLLLRAEEASSGKGER